MIVKNDKKEEILTQFEDVEPIRLKNITSDLMYEKSILKYKQNNKYGIIDFSGKKLTRPIYDEIDSLPYKEGELIVKQNEKYGILNMNGNILVDIDYDEINVDGYYTDENNYKYAGYIVSNKTEEGYRYGYINSYGETILKVEYNELSRINDIENKDSVYLICAKNGQFGVIKDGKNLLNNEYQSIRYDENNSVLVVEKTKKYGIANLDGKLIVPVEYSQIDITGIYIYAQNTQGTTVYNTDGTQANVETNISILNTDNDKYRIRINNENGTKYGIIGKDGKKIVDEKYNYIEYLYNNYFIVSDENSKLGVIDDKDNVKIEIKYDALQKVQDTEIIQTTLVEENKIELYDNQMNNVCSMEKATVLVKDKYVKMYNEKEIKYFNKTGKELKNTEVFENNKLFSIKDENNNWGFVDRGGNIIVDYQYEKVTEFNEYGFAAVKKEGKWGAINEQGEEVVKPSYQLNEEIEPIFLGKYYKVTYAFGEFYFTDENK